MPSYFVREVADKQSLSQGVFDRGRRAAAFLRQIADADRAMVNHVAIPLVHTAAIIPLRQTDNLCGGFFYALILTLRVAAPSFRLIPVWNDDNKTGFRMRGAIFQHGLRRQRVEARTSSRVKRVNFPVIVKIIWTVENLLR